MNSADRHFNTIPECDGRTDGQNCYINIARQHSSDDAREISVHSGAGMLAVHHAADFLVLSFFIYVGLVCLLGLVVRLRFPPGDRQSMKPVCGLSHGQSVH